MESYKYIVDVEVYDTKTNDWAQGKYLYHGTDDVYWCDDIDKLLETIRYDLTPLS